MSDIRDQLIEVQRNNIKLLERRVELLEAELRDLKEGRSFTPPSDEYDDLEYQVIAVMDELHASLRSIYEDREYASNEALALVMNAINTFFDKKISTLDVNEDRRMIRALGILKQKAMSSSKLPELPPKFDHDFWRTDGDGSSDS